MTTNAESFSPSISVVIPVKNAAAYLPELLPALFRQENVHLLEVVLVDSMSTDNTRAIAEADERVRIVPIENFSHGRARNLGAREARGEMVVLMSQDALPEGTHWMERLIQPFADSHVAAVYSRQIPREDANPMERYFLHTHFPAGDTIRRVKKEGEELTLEKVFFSNVSGAVRRDLLLKYPFDEDLIMSEDQQVSRDLMNAGYVVVYEPSSVVRHSHNYTLSVCFKRYFDSVYSLTLVFPSHQMGTSVSMGRKYLIGEIRYIAKNYPWWLPYYVLYTFAKACGTLMAHFGDRLPRWLLKRISLHAYHWDDH